MGRIAIVRKRLATTGTDRWYCYAWRGGPHFWTADGDKPDPANPPAGWAAALEKARQAFYDQRRESENRTVDTLVKRFEASGEFAILRPRTQETYLLYNKQILAEFGDDELAIFDTDEIVEDIIEWRDEKARAGRYRAADHRVRTLGRLLSFANTLRWCRKNPAQDIPRLYSSDRSDIVFTEAERQLIIHGDGAGIPPARPCDADIFIAAFYTGGRRADLVALPINADDGLELSWRTSKGYRRGVRAHVPILPPLRALIDRRKADTSTPATTLLVNSRGRPWTERGLSDAVRARLDACGIDRDKHLHDSRGTFATELCAYGFSDEAVSEMLGWDDKDRVARIRRKYVNREQYIRDQIARVNDERQRRGLS